MADVTQFIGKQHNRVVHSSHFQAIFGSFLISFLISFKKNQTLPLPSQK